jgi:hypothetical protein
MTNHSPFAVATDSSLVKSASARAILEPLAAACDAAELAFDRARDAKRAKVARKGMDSARKAFALAIEPLMKSGAVTIGGDNFAR